MRRRRGRSVVFGDVLGLTDEAEKQARNMARGLRVRSLSPLFLLAVRRCFVVLVLFCHIVPVLLHRVASFTLSQRVTSSKFFRSRLASGSQFFRPPLIGSQLFRAFSLSPLLAGRSFFVLSSRASGSSSFRSIRSILSVSAALVGLVSPKSPPFRTAPAYLGDSVDVVPHGF